MTQKNAVLVTGVAGDWGARVAARLIAESGCHVIGVDAEPPAEDIKGLDFIQADIRNSLLAELFKAEEIDTVCHLTFLETFQPTEAAFDVNVMGTVKVLGASTQAGVRKVVLKSSTAVYGASPANPAFLTEAHPLKGSHHYGYTRDMVEIEAFCNGFRRQVPGMALTILRFPNIVGPAAETPMTRFLKEPRTPTLLGFDPMMQVIHEDDVVAALVYATVNDVPGVFNVGAEGVMPLSRLTALAGKVAIPILHPLAYWGLGLLGHNSRRLARYAPIEPDYLRYPWIGDLAKMRTSLGFSPRYTADEALREFAGQQRLRRYLPESATRLYDEERLRDTIARRRRARRQPPIVLVAGEEEEDNDS
ncbi:MAG: NAD-dependent epimerase/dehydratase family protein [Ardenticatenaceae bacterium]|nr:NAD-dependent epimerase/dehydratase family protein [Ardenticatenaceae bacterium]